MRFPHGLLNGSEDIIALSLSLVYSRGYRTLPVASLKNIIALFLCFNELIRRGYCTLPMVSFIDYKKLLYVPYGIVNSLGDIGSLLNRRGLLHSPYGLCSLHMVESSSKKLLLYSPHGLVI